MATKTKRVAKKKAKRTPKPRHERAKKAPKRSAPASSTSYLQELDPLLRLGASRAKLERPFGACCVPSSGPRR